eukprot:scaffold42784_cov214-Amphora_coffeaeformis.AAC.15
MQTNKKPKKCVVVRPFLSGFKCDRNVKGRRMAKRLVITVCDLLASSSFRQYSTISFLPRKTASDTGKEHGENHFY